MADVTAYPMWQHWRSKHGVVDALQCYYQAALADDPRLQLALTQIQVAEAAINAIMAEKGL